VIVLSSNQDSDVGDLERYVCLGREEYCSSDNLSPTFFVVVVVCCSDLSGEESEVGPSQVKILDPTSSPIK